MNAICYTTGETAKVGDIVALAGQKGTITIVGDGLLEWGLTAEEIKEGRVMIEFENGGLLCTDAASEDLNLIAHAKNSLR